MDCATTRKELFIELSEAFTVPSFPIHHDVREREPDPEYIRALRSWVDGLLPVAPDFFGDLTYFFDPGETLKPCFFKLYRCGEEHYLYLLRVNLVFRPLEMDLLERGGNDRTASYRSRRLTWTATSSPSSSILAEGDPPATLVVKQRYPKPGSGKRERAISSAVSGWTPSHQVLFQAFMTRVSGVIPFIPSPASTKPSA
jgi:hypothetical protein